VLDPGGLQKALEQDPSYALAYAALGEAVDLGEEQLSVNSRDAVLLAELADAQVMLGHASQARALAALAPGDAEVVQIGAGIDEMLGRREAALRSSRGRSLRLVPAGRSSAARRSRRCGRTRASQTL